MILNSFITTPALVNEGQPIRTASPGAPSRGAREVRVVCVYLDVAPTDGFRVGVDMRLMAGAVEAAEMQGGDDVHEGDSRHDTSDFSQPTPGNLPVDYVLPIAGAMTVTRNSVFWPAKVDSLYRLTGEYPFHTSDHRLVQVTVSIAGEEPTPASSRTSTPTPTPASEPSSPSVQKPGLPNTGNSPRPRECPHHEDETTPGGPTIGRATPGASQTVHRFVDLRSSFSNPRKPLVSLISRVLRGSRARRPRTRGVRITDQRGPVRENSHQSQTRLCVSNRAELLGGYAAGAPVRELATRFRVHRGTVREIARQAGMAARQPELPDAVRQAAARLYADGLTLAQVATRLGISNEAVRSAVLACGGAVRTGSRRQI